MNTFLNNFTLKTKRFDTMFGLFNGLDEQCIVYLNRKEDMGIIILKRRVVYVDKKTKGFYFMIFKQAKLKEEKERHEANLYKT